MPRAILVLVLACVCRAAQPSGALPRNPELVSLERQAFELVNNERAWRGLARLKWDPRLAEEARRQASNMATRYFFSHVDPVRGDLPDRLRKAGIPWHECSENLLQESGYDEPARFAVLTWMESPGHRKNILNRNVTHAGVGAARRSDGTLFLAQVFISP
ncbi:MAG: CAP domain-containing protein [Bryobacteraceae bacterium]|jgi:uncharacterized protein YkwD